MEKFVGKVNGKSFDNEKDFEKAAAEAIKKNDGTLAISSYYSYSDDEEPAKIEEKETKKIGKKNNNLKEKDYVINDQVAGVNDDKTLYYPVSDELKKKLRDADNKDEIKSVSEKKTLALTDLVKKKQEDVKELDRQIESLQDKLYEIQESILELDAQKLYYNNIIDILSDDKTDETVAAVIPGVIAYLREIGFLK